MKLIVGLGNPGIDYENTRHNIGFKAIDAFMHSKDISQLNKTKFNGMFYKAKDFIIAKPQTFMNLSGDFVRAIVDYYKINISDILIIYDEINLDCGVARMNPKGSSGGQNGMKDIIQKLGTSDVPRLRIGIGKPNNNSKNHVLGPFSKIQLMKINPLKEKLVQSIDKFINEDILLAMNFLN